MIVNKAVASIRGTALLLLLLLVARSSGSDAVSRMQLSKLKATRSSLEALREDWQEVQRGESEFHDFRAQIHVHSHFSHDSVAPIEEIIQAAVQCNSQVVMFNDHPSEDYDFFLDGHQGMRDGVLLIPGAEKEGFLLFPNRSIQGEPYGEPQELADLVRSDGGMVFLSHLEERMEWEIRGITGNEIYNTHADVMDEKQFLSMLRNPLALLGILPALKQYPQEMFGAILDYPEDYLRRWDQLCQTAPHTGVAANDAHHNQVIRALVTEDHQLAIEDALGKPVATLDPENVPLVKPLIANRKPGDKVMELDLDPYERSFRHVSTHLLMRELTREEVFQALKAGRAYVSFEWLADPTGFWFGAHCGSEHWPMGSQIQLPTSNNGQGSDTGLMQLSAKAPLPVLFKLFKNGRIIHELRGRTLTAKVTEPGVYRVEAWLVVAEELKPWILSNPIYLH